jgi:hypothetical protein
MYMHAYKCRRGAILGGEIVIERKDKWEHWDQEENE